MTRTGGPSAAWRNRCRLVSPDHLAAPSGRAGRGARSGAIGRSTFPRWGMPPTVRLRVRSPSLGGGGGPEVPDPGRPR
ncbi:hypothetical protein FTX61_16170 [Nitriliruptoraceae bacterium ZYF776]|nr:hypothetical protein [Profundirhabdus halotolerans]